MRTPFMIVLIGLAWVALMAIAATTSQPVWRPVLVVVSGLYGYAYGWTLRDSEKGTWEE